jgi:glyoxylase-like metal-dependent hydrolase (beta-lactamase superfamily II)
MPTPLTNAPLPKIGGDKPLVESEAVRIHGLSLGPSNAYLIETEEGVTLVDAGLPATARSVERKLKAIGRPDDLCQIFITHAHLDHFGAAAALRKRTGAPIVIHEADAQALAEGRTDLGSVRSWEWTRLPMPVLERMITIEPTPPDRIVKGGEQLETCGLDATVLHTPGHTDGSSTLIVRDPATGNTYAFVGDLLSSVGGLHVQSSYAQDWAQISLSVEDLRAAAPDYIFPGHGATVITQDELNNMAITGPAAR